MSHNSRRSLEDKRTPTFQRGMQVCGPGTVIIFVLEDLKVSGTTLETSSIFGPFKLCNNYLVALPLGTLVLMHFNVVAPSSDIVKLSRMSVPP